MWSQAARSYTVVQAVEDGPRDYFAGKLARARCGSLQRERPVESILVVVGNELGQHRSDVSLTERQDVVQALLTQAPREPLRVRVRTRRLDRCARMLSTPSPASRVAKSAP